MERKERKVLLKLPIIVEEFFGSPEGCEECLSRAEDLGMGEDATKAYLEDNCSDCVDEDKISVAHESFDYIDPVVTPIRHFFSSGVDNRTGKETTTIIFNGNSVIRYQLSIDDFLKKYKKYKDFVII